MVASALLTERRYNKQLWAEVRVVLEEQALVIRVEVPLLERVAGAAGGISPPRLVTLPVAPAGNLERRLSTLL
jgi:hypothetical protein